MTGEQNARSLREKKIGKLKKADEISSVFDFKCRISSAHFIALGKPNHLEKPRIVVMVAKKTHGHAVRRNYMRRVCIEFCRKRQKHIGAMDVVIRVIKPFIKQDFTKVSHEIETVIAGLSKCRES